MTKSVRDQVEAIKDDYAMSLASSDLGWRVDVGYRALSFVVANDDCLAASEETAAERDALKAEVERLRGVIEEAANALSEEAASLKSFGDYASGMPYLRVAGTLRAALQPQGGE